MGLYASAGKRLLDVCIAAGGLVLLSPLFLLVGLLGTLVSPGPVLYFQERVGKDGRVFRIAKFRTMRAATERDGPGITVAGDSRVTAFGRILRSLKIDELPQLWNVLKGEMSVVGPRPEVPQYVKAYTSEQKQVLSVRPGITDPSSIAYRREEELLAGQADPQRYYREVILPDKLSLSLEYIRRISFRNDLALLVQTAISIFVTRPRFSTPLRKHS